MIRFVSAFVAILLLGMSPLSAQPPGAAIEAFADIMGYHDVTAPPFHAAGDGVTDDTAALQAALDRAKQLVGETKMVQHVFLPPGTYLVSDKLTLGASRTHKVRLVGAGRDATVLRLADASPGFQAEAQGDNAGWDAHLNPVVTFFEGGSDNNSFWNTVEDLTIDIGVGNPGAIALEFHNNNVGAIRRVTLRSSDPEGRGAIGLKVHRGLAGIGLIRDVRVEGFDYGMWFHQWKIGYVLEDVELVGQRRAGLFNSQKLITVHRLHSTNAVPAIVNADRAGMVVCIDSRLVGDGSGGVAIENEGYLYARNVTTRGYDASLREGGQPVTDASLTQWWTGSGMTLPAGATAASLDLPVADPPDEPWGEVDDWAVVTPVAGSDVANIQSAIDSGATTVVLTPGEYTIDGPITIRGNVRRFHGGWSRVDFADNFQKKGRPVFVFEDTSHDAIIFECFAPAWVGAQNLLWLQNNSSRTLVLRDLFLGWGDYYRNDGDRPGKLFIENVASGGAGSAEPSPQWVFTRQQVWARQFNPERNYPHIVNDGGTLWLLGSKVGERHGPFIVSKNNAKTEAFGVFFNHLGDAPDAIETRAMVTAKQSDVAIVGLEDVNARRSHHPSVAARLRPDGGIMDELAREAFDVRNADPREVMIPLLRLHD